MGKTMEMDMVVDMQMEYLVRSAQHLVDIMQHLVFST